ncbi:glycosyltransferase family 2 protein [Candidatus Pacearchaeota archaeon]|nr:glycosyltransferase family 2 protein [Candidatus Pacearchaeota archaeon]
MNVSVIIPTYNEEKDVEDCLKSLRSQSIKNVEIVIVDDGSTDSTIKLAEKYKIKILKQNHQGPGAARNFGAKNALGNILIFIDADMAFDKNYLKNLIKPILEDKTGKMIGTTHDYEIATNTDNVWGALWGKIRVSKDSAKNVKIFRAIRKDKFLELGGFDPKYGYADDQTFWFKYKIKPVIAKNTTCYHRNPDTLKETYKQSKWIGASWKERYLIFRIPLINYFSVLVLFISLPLIVLLKSLKIKLEKNKFSLKNVIKFYSIKFFGYAKGIFRAVYLGEVWK